MYIHTQSDHGLLYDTHIMYIYIYIHIWRILQDPYSYICISIYIYIMYMYIYLPLSLSIAPTEPRPGSWFTKGGLRQRSFRNQGLMDITELIHGPPGCRLHLQTSGSLEVSPIRQNIAFNRASILLPRVRRS